MKAYYNDNSLEAARWLQWLQLYAAISPGWLDSRSIHDVRLEDLENVTRAHFFAGIGGWDYALQLAGWPEDRPIWTASLPCQPFSVAGQQRGIEDERHLWPVFRDLVAQCRPAAILGEQVSSPAGRSWLASVQADLEALGYSTAAADLCAAGVGAPHIRQRLYWMAHNEVRRWSGVESDFGGCRGSSVDGGLGNSGSAGSRGLGGSVLEEKRDGHPKWGESRNQLDESFAAGFRVWDDIIFVFCGDGKARPVKPGLEPLVNGVPNRLGRIRGYGNSIVPQVAAVFIRSVMDILEN